MGQLDEKGVILACSQCGQRNRISFAQLDQSIRCGQCKTALRLPSIPLEIRREAEFQALIGASSLSVLVDFWAPWCGPCKMMAPELEKVANRTLGKLIVAKVNTDAVESLGQRYQISSIPTLILFVDGREARRIAGARPAAEIEAFGLAGATEATRS